MSGQISKEQLLETENRLLREMAERYGGVLEKEKEQREATLADARRKAKEAIA